MQTQEVSEAGHTADTVEQAPGIKRTVYGPYRGKDGRARVVHVRPDRKTSSESYARYLWRLHRGPIPDGWDVDHIDGDRTNDALDNLQVLPASENKRKHHKQKPWQAAEAGRTRARFAMVQHRYSQPGELAALRAEVAKLRGEG